MNHALDMKTLAELALLVGKFDWKNTPIEITQAVRATDPLNLARDCWWHQAEPRDAAGGKIIVNVDDVGNENMEARSGRPVTSAQIAAAQEDSENDGADQLLPDDTEPFQLGSHGSRNPSTSVETRSLYGTGCAPRHEKETWICK